MTCPTCGADDGPEWDDVVEWDDERDRAMASCPGCGIDTRTGACWPWCDSSAQLYDDPA